MTTARTATICVAAYTAGLASFFLASYLWLDRHFLT